KYICKSSIQYSSDHNGCVAISSNTVDDYGKVTYFKCNSQIFVWLIALHGKTRQSRWICKNNFIERSKARFYIIKLPVLRRKRACFAR
ncbi:MAG: hypothetical protein ACFNM4_08295, partial [Prevotella nigrescens]